MVQNQIKTQLEGFWAEVFREALMLSRSVSSVELKDPDSHGDPPDALYRVTDSDGRISTQWAELTGVYPSREAARIVFNEARGITSDQDSGWETLRSLSGMNDSTIAKRAHNSILKKTKKSSYSTLVTKYALGHLVLIVPYQSYPLMNRYTATLISDHIPISVLQSQSRFCSVSLLYKNPDYEDESSVIHLPDSASGYAFLPLWQLRDPRGHKE